ncbi:MAG: hypothetical protein WCT14_12630 [Treponemataceae bacterium]
MRRLLIVLLSLGMFASASLAAETVVKPSLDFGLGLEGGYDADIGFWNMGYGRLFFKDGPFSLIAHLSFNNDKKYSPAHANTTEGSIGGYYFFMDEGGLAYDGKNLSMKVGRFRHYDQIDSPYSLFVNSEGITANLGQVRYENENFIYESRWVELNHRSGVGSPAWNAYWKAKEDDPTTTTVDETTSTGFPDRGVNLKTYALKFGSMRFGLQDTAVYSGTNFDAEYFVNPIPSYFIQYMKGTGGRPWATNQNDNSTIGLFWDWKREDGSRYYAQYLMDDFYIPYLSKYLYPNQMAWAFGGSWKTDYGTFGFHHGGALKYTFQSNTVNSDDSDAREMAYGYTYYPDTAYYSDGTTVVALDITDNSFGFKYGENSAAFQVDWQNRFAGAYLKAALEFVLAGSNSAANPWHDGTSEEGLPTSWLADDVLQKTIAVNVNAARKFGDFDVSLALKAGYTFNTLALVDPSDVATTSSTIDQYSKIWKASQNNAPIFAFTLGVRYVFKIF